ncbi:MAG TPA: DUF1127 domain-containing protein [Xanthobacteraceae bacterium]|nr:DUF1127 domain-containing protein [Xanthobacteraceae bacterium]
MTLNTENVLALAQAAGRTIVTSIGHLVCRASKLRKIVKHRREALALTQFDDRMLADIGLRRSDLRDALAESFWRDPTTLLVERVPGHRKDRDRPAQWQRPMPFVAPSIIPGPYTGEGFAWKSPR